MNSAGDQDVYLAKLDKGGKHLWSQRFGSAWYDASIGVATGATGKIAIAGYFQGQIDFGGGTLQSAGSNDIFVAAFAP
ncbi:MAG: hypothetical protein HY744_15220 [Deltaproteobacteria bacterium]|nr:hypothetical protein [Deltaproteobacteria bacterium]